jgi:hypothetical protein
MKDQKAIAKILPFTRSSVSYKNGKMGKTYNLFLSHSWSYQRQFQNLKNLLLQRKYFNFRDYSVPSEDPIEDANNAKKLYQEIFNQIKPCHIVLVMAGVYVSHSNWMKSEIEISKKLEKPIVAIRPRGNEKISNLVRSNADDIANWNTESIVEKIRSLAI